MCSVQMVLTDSWSRSHDVSDDVMKFSVLKISDDDDISGTGRPINFVFDSRCLLSAVSEPYPVLNLTYFFSSAYHV